MYINISNNDDFKKEVLESIKPVFIDFWAPWCPPCRQFSPIFEEYSTQSTTYKCVKINVDEYNDIALEQKVMNIPTVLLYKDGKVVDRYVGIASPAILNEMLKKY